MTKQTLIRYAISSVITFAAAFFLTLGTQLETLTPDTLSQSAIFGALVVAVRAAAKVVFETVLIPFVTKLANTSQ